MGTAAIGVSRRKRSTLAACLVATALLSVAVVVLGAGDQRAAAQAKDPRPNVLMVMTDDQTVEQLKAMRNVRRLLVERGTTFKRNFASFPLCCPSRATYLTGQYNHNNGVLGNKPPAGGYYKLDSTNTLPVWVDDARYHTAHIGKYLNGYGTRDPREVPPGWNEWYGSIDPTTYRYYGYTLNQNGTPKTYAETRRNYQADVYTRKAVDFIDRRAPNGTPFFLSVAYLAPHGGGPKIEGDRCQRSAKPAPRHEGAFRGEPLPRPPSFNERRVRDKPQFIRDRDRFGPNEIKTIKRKYQCRRESLLAVDEGVKAMIGELRQSGELSNTLILFTSDNGFFTGEHRIPDGKIHHYEPSTRVPLVLRGPGVPEDRRVTDLTANIDLAPTIVDAANATPRRVIDGRSLLPLARRPGDFASRDVLLQNGPDSNDARPRYAAIRTPRHKYVEYRTGERELYDLERDPFELRSRHDDPSYAARRRELARKLDALRDCAGPTCRGGP